MSFQQTPTSKERMGYPTQKPLSLLERVINSSSNQGDVVLDPFCGCGTAVHASQKLNRRWIGIDITHLAIGLIEKRMKDAFGVSVEVMKLRGPPTLLNLQKIWQDATNSSLRKLMGSYANSKRAAK